MIGLLCWAAEFTLEILGARLARKRNLHPLAAFLSFRALADLLCWIVSLSAGPFFYAWSWYAQAVIQYILFAVVVVYLSSKLLDSDRLTLRFYSGAVGSLVFLAIAFFHARAFTMVNVLHFAAATYFLLGLMMCLALLMQKRPQFISLGIPALVLASSNGLLSAMQAQHWNVTACYPIGEILALGLWWWAMRKEPEQEQVVRGSLGTRLPVTGWICEEYEEA